MRGIVWGTLGCLLVVAGTSQVAGEEAKKGEAKSRRFTFTYAATVEGLSAGQVARVWLPVPPSNDEQQVERKSSQLPAKFQQGVEKKYGNEVLYLEIAAPVAGRLPISITYDVTRREVKRLDKPGRPPAPLTNMERALLLAPDRLGPITGKPLELIKDLKFSNDRIATARQLYDRVDEHVKYDKSRPGYGTGDVEWVCDSRFGNCCDFHSLFMSLARSQGIPARFEIGFPLPDERGAGPVGGYHCWAFFFEEARGWVPVDISEADKHPELKDYYFGNLTENRVTFSRGRDLTLDPPQAGPPLNFFVYPYVEVAGKPLPKEQLKLQFEFADAK